MSNPTTDELIRRFPQRLREAQHHTNGAFTTMVELRGGAEGFVTVKRADDHINGQSEWFRWEARVCGEHDERHPRLDADE